MMQRLLAGIITTVLFTGTVSAWPNIKINNDTTTEIQNEQQIMANPLDPDNVVAVWRDFRTGYRRVGCGTSFDGGVTWSEQLLVDDNYIRHSDPGITVDSQGNFYAVILSYTGSTSEPNGLFVQKSTDGGLTWNESVPVVTGVPGVFEDKELIACDRSGSVHDGNLYVPWARFGGSVEIMCARSVDGGAGFQSPVSLESGSVQWPNPAVGANGEVYIAWTNFSYGLRFARSLDGGVTFTTPVTVDPSADFMENINGGILVFSFPALDVDLSAGPHRGRIHLAYMVDVPGSGTNILYRYSDNQGVSWSSSVRLNDDPTGVSIDQFHPWLAVSSDSGEVAVMFYDRRNDPSNLLMDVYWTRSSDGGITWSSNERITSVSSDPTAAGKNQVSSVDSVEYSNFGVPILSNRAGLIGEYNGMCAAGSGWNMIWTDTRESNQDTFTAPVVLVTPTPAPTVTPVCFHHGDVNFDGEITSGDAQLTFSIALGSYTPSYPEFCAADCNGDDEVTAGDAQGVFMAALGVSNCLDPLIP